MREMNSLFGKDATIRDVVMFLAYMGILTILLIGLIALKVYTFEGLTLIYIYTLFVSTFMITRIGGSFFYKPYANKVDMNYTPSVTFVIPSKNEGGAIFHTLQKCTEVDYPAELLEIIAINDGSTDNTLAEMRRARDTYKDYDITVIDWKKNKGKREGMKYGFEKAKGEIVIQLDSDSFMDSDALRKLIMPFKNKKVAATVAHADPSNKDVNLLTKMQTAYYFMSFRALKATESLFDMVFCCSGCCSAYRKEYVLPLIDEWINEKFMGKPVVFGDDRALTHKLLEYGYKTVYCADAQSYTAVPEKWKQFTKQQIRWKKSWIINAIKGSRFIVKRDPFIAFVYFFPMILISILTPIIAFKTLIVNPILFGLSPLIYLFGTLVVSSIYTVHYKIFSNDRYGKYMFLWGILNMVFLCYLIVYAAYDLKNLGWGTR